HVLTCFYKSSISVSQFPGIPPVLAESAAYRRDGPSPRALGPLVRAPGEGAQARDRSIPCVDLFSDRPKHPEFQTIPENKNRYTGPCRRRPWEVYSARRSLPLLFPLLCKIRLR